VREHRKYGADLLKIMPSGGVGSIGDDPSRQLMTNDEIQLMASPLNQSQSRPRVGTGQEFWPSGRQAR
jgi:hypothetical protein